MAINIIFRQIITKSYLFHFKPWFYNNTYVIGDQHFSKVMCDMTIYIYYFLSINWRKLQYYVFSKNSI